MQSVDGKGFGSSKDVSQEKQQRLDNKKPLDP